MRSKILRITAENAPPSFEGYPEQPPLDFDRLGIDQTSFAWQNLLGQSEITEWTPTISGQTNLDSVTVDSACYLDLGQYVIGGGRFSADPTLTATATDFELSPPTDATFGAQGYCFGVAFCGDIAGMGARVHGSTTNNTIRVVWVSTDVTDQPWSFIFMYRKG